MLRKLLDWLTSRMYARIAGSAVFGQETADQLIAEGNRAEGRGNFPEACERYRKAVETAPGYAKVHLNLGIGLEAVGEVGEAIRAYEQALAIDPTDAYANYNLGKLHYARGALAQAERYLRSSIAAKADLAEAHLALSNTLDSQGKPEAAVRELEIALQKRPGYFGALYNKGLILAKTNRVAEAESALRQAAAVDPENADANYHLANLLWGRKEYGEAERLLRLALKRKPEFPEAHVALYYVYDAQGNVAAAIAELEAALSQRPDWVDALYNYGIALKKSWRLAEAETAFRRAIAIDPAYLPAYRLLGSIFVMRSRIGDALQIFKEGRERASGGRRPESTEQLVFDSAELFLLNFSEDISSEALFAAHKTVGEQLERVHPPRFKSFRNVADPDRRLRIGYVSGDFCLHPVALFALPLIEHHDRSGYEIFCYSMGDKVDDLTGRISGTADVWRNLASVSAGNVADAIHEDGIDILVDLSGHTGFVALSAFAQQPAPVQVTWLGYMNTTGLTRIHYRICDAYTDPPGESDRFHTEALVRLPNTQWCYRPQVAVDPATAPPSKENGFITFGTFNQFSKISSTCRRMWAEILMRLPRSRLLVGRAPDGYAQESLLRDLENAGVAASRIVFPPQVALDEYFNRFNEVDVALDTTPYSGCTTTFDTLWMGVPVVTLPRSSSLSRGTASILSAVGLREWIASTPEEYVRLAVEIALDQAALTEFRASSRKMLLRSPLMDEPRFARDVEDAYRRMWRAWCDSEAKASPARGTD